MRTAIHVIFACMWASGSVCAAPVSWRDVGEAVPIIGRLGVPLGTAVEIEATLVSGESLPAFRTDSRFWTYRFLRVESVAGVAAEDRPIMSFVVEAGPMDPISDDPAEAGRLRERQKQRDLQVMPLGTRLRLLVFESGVFDGQPPRGPRGDEFPFLSELPDPDVRANPHFRTLLHVREPESPPLDGASPVGGAPSTPGE